MKEVAIITVPTDYREGTSDLAAALNDGWEISHIIDRNTFQNFFYVLLIREKP